MNAGLSDYSLSADWKKQDDAESQTSRAPAEPESDLRSTERGEKIAESKWGHGFPRPVRRQQDCSGDGDRQARRSPDRRRTASGRQGSRLLDRIGRYSFSE